MTESMKEFVELLSTNPRAARDVQEVNDAISKEAMEAMRIVAARYGVTLTEADFDIAVSEDIDDEELDAVAGGRKVCFAAGFDLVKNSEGKLVPAPHIVPAPRTIQL